MIKQINRAKLNEALSQIEARELMNGTILIAQGDKIVAERAFGKADLARETPLTIHSAFNLASVSKPVTALATLILVDRGVLSLSDDLTKWLDLPYEGITIQELLTHTSGLPDYMELFELNWNHAEIADNHDVLRLFQEHQPAVLFPPKERLEYSNTGYVFLALIVEKASGIAFGDFLSQEIYQPLKMASTFSHGIRLLSVLPNDFAKGYVADPYLGKPVLPDTLKETALVYYLDGILGDGGMISTVHDLYRFERALAAGKLLSPELLAKSYQVAEPKIPTDFHYGYGWIIEESDVYGKMIFHTGGWIGYSTLLKRYSEHDIVMIILRNIEMDFDHEQAVEKALEQAIFGEDFILPEKVPAPFKTIEVSDAHLRSFVGEYQIEDETKLPVTIKMEKEGVLSIKLPNFMSLAIHPLTPTMFIIRGLGIMIELSQSEGQKWLKVIDGDTIQTALKDAKEDDI